MKETPLQTVKRLYGGKDKLIASISDFVRDDDEEKSEAATRLKVMSNKRLLRLSVRADAVKSHGGRDALATKVASAQGRSKDEDYVARLKKMTAGRLLDMLAASQTKN